MIVNCMPWMLDVDVSGTKKIYDKRCFTENTKDNQFLFEILGYKEKKFFKDLGIDLHKIYVSTNQLEIPNDKGIRIRNRIISADFFMKGSFLQISTWQKELYRNGEILEMDSEYMSVNDCNENLKVFVLGKMSLCMTFKPLYSRVEKYKLKAWKPGYISGKLILIQEVDGE